MSTMGGVPRRGFGDLVSAVIEEAWRRARRRRLIYAGIVLSLAVIGAVVTATLRGPSSSNSTPAAVASSSAPVTGVAVSARTARHHYHLYPGDTDFTRTYGGFLQMILAIGALMFMALPAINLVNLNVSRIMERASEIGVRKAFGASSRTLVGQFIVESIVLTLVGGAIGLLLSLLVMQAINASGLIPYTPLAVSHRVFVAGLGLSLLFAMMAGALPAWRMSRLHPVEALHGRVR